MGNKKIKTHVSYDVETDSFRTLYKKQAVPDMWRLPDSTKNLQRAALEAARKLPSGVLFSGSAASYGAAGASGASVSVGGGGFGGNYVRQLDFQREFRNSAIDYSNIAIGAMQTSKLAPDNVVSSELKALLSKVLTKPEADAELSPAARAIITQLLKACEKV